jgi:hypothetical protein
MEEKSLVDKLGDKLGDWWQSWSIFDKNQPENVGFDSNSMDNQP